MTTEPGYVHRFDLRRNQREACLGQAVQYRIVERFTETGSAAAVLSLRAS